MDVRIVSPFKYVLLNEIIYERTMNISMCTLRPSCCKNLVDKLHLQFSLAADTAAHLTYCCR